MSFLPLSFGFPAILLGLAALPVIWWLLRLTPPKPRSEIFPPLAILARVMRKEETPRRSPWWLTLLRLVMAALVILALAEPVLNPREAAPARGGGLALVVDNGWASAPDWEVRVATAGRLIADAADKPVLLAFTAEKPNAEIGPFDAAEAQRRLAAASPRPVPTDRPAVFARVAQALQAVPDAAVAVLSDGLAADGDEDAFATLLSGNAASLLWIAPDDLSAIGISDGRNLADAFSFTAIRPQADAAPRQAVAAALDDRGRRIAETTVAFGAGESEAEGLFRVPFELRNDFSVVVIDGESHAAATRLLDENARRRRVGLISQAEAGAAQPLLSPLYYIRRALEPFSDLIEPASTDLAEAIPQILEQRPAIVVLADVGTLPASARERLIDWLEGGGTLVRFAGPRLAAAGNDEELLPVRLRIGERALGGALSWTEPQPVTEFPPAGPFADLAAPVEVTVSRQVLAEPTADIVERTWAALADGTPLVTGASRGDGTLVLFHVSPEATWSSLPISGTFVEMLRRLVQLSSNQGRIDANGGATGAALAPYRMIGADGTLTAPGPDARPLLPGAVPAVTLENPPGFYGGEEGMVAHNLLAPDAVLAPLAQPQTALPVARAAYAFDEAVDLKGPLVAAALALMALDTLAVLWMGGAFSRRLRPSRAASGAANGAASGAAMLVLAGAIVVGLADPLAAQEAETADEEAIAAITRTRIAYVLTGDGAIDSLSRAGLQGLSRFLADKTALEPGEPASIDIESDELAFYPLIYWPVDAEAAMPSEAALARVDAYMREGGTVLFDTRDRYAPTLDGSASPSTGRLRDMLAAMNVPPLEPVPADHVLTKTFYIMPEFPGRYAGGPLWVEASLDAANPENRPVRTGDGVTPIMITANDFAGAWATDSSGSPLLPTVPADPMQRVYAFRAGVNIMMYVLTGNYKSDQVHVPILLERLGQ
ncbi:MAG: RNA-binding protein [Hyphomicrobiales bacterium]|nr:MAG: RNA-binding protein [Hyphomicrobiales bacterium]